MGAFIGTSSWDGSSSGGYYSTAYASGSCYATALPYWTAGSTCVSTIGTLPSYSESPAERKARLKRESEAEKRERERLANRTLADLDDDDKEELMGIINDFHKQYKREQEVKQLMSGIKWFLIFIGVAILFNFPRILSIIETAIK